MHYYGTSVWYNKFELFWNVLTNDEDIENWSTTDFVTFRHPFSSLIFVTHFRPKYKIYIAHKMGKKCTNREKPKISPLATPTPQIFLQILSCPSDNNFTLFPYCAVLAYSLYIFVFLLLLLWTTHMTLMIHFWG